jgi:hypothetical protein
MHVIYRISENGYLKEKPEYVNNANCLRSALFVFAKAKWTIIADNVNEETKAVVEESYGDIKYVNVGHGAGTFNKALDIALGLPEDETVYFLENDYLHRYNADRVLESAFDLEFDYVTLYDHPDKYMNPFEGGNPFCSNRSEATRVYLGEHCHWKLTNSTTMTFAAKVKTIKQDISVLRKWTSGSHPHDFQMFTELTQRGRRLASPLPGYATHGETKWLSPLTNWKETLWKN